MGETLKKFLSEWLEWAEAGAPLHEAFDEHYGLCANLGYWITENCLTLTEEEADTAEEEFALLQAAEFGDECLYPFGRTEYLVASDRGTQHTNEKRLAWVRKQLGK